MSISSQNIIAVVMGGGAGTRLFPLTKMRSKPAVPLAGKYRLIDIPLSNCINSGIHRIFVLTQFNSASLNTHVSTAYRFDQFSRGFVTILAAEQTFHSKDWFQGTADAVRQCMYHLESHHHSHVLILSGDQLYQMNYRNMYQAHIDRDAEISIATIPVTAEEATGFGILKTDDEGRIVEFREKPPAEELGDLKSKVPSELEHRGRVYLASMGIYIFGREILQEELKQEGFTDFGKEIIPQAIQKHQVYSYAFSDYWSDIGTIQSFFQANLELCKPLPAFNLFNPKFPIYTSARLLPPSKIENSYVQDSMIAEGCVISNSQIVNSIVGIRSIIGKNTTIKESIIMGADYYPWHQKQVREEQSGPPEPGVGKGSHLEKVILDKNASVGKNCKIVNRDGVNQGEGDNFYIRDGIVILPKNSVISDGTTI